MKDYVENQCKELLLQIKKIKELKDETEKTEFKSFVFYESFVNSIDDVDIEDMLLYIFKIIVWSIYGILPDLKGFEKVAFDSVILGVSNAKKRREKQSENGSKGGRPKKNNTNNIIENEIFSLKKYEWNDILLLQEKAKRHFTVKGIPNEALFSLEALQQYCNNNSLVQIE